MGRVLWSSAYLFVAFWCGWLTLDIVGKAVHAWPVYTTDFTVFYTAARVPFDVVYDTARITAAQAWAGVSALDARPFPYPPTFLFLLWPFGQLGVLPALVCWVALGLTAYCVAAWKLIGGMWPLMLLSPTMAVTAMSGQVTFLMGAALIAGVLWLPKRPLLAGVIFGLAATIKPQVFALVPFALVFAGQWRALGASVSTGALVGLASLAVHQGMWLDWLRSLPEFNNLIARQPWAPHMSATPVGFLQSLGVTNGYVFAAVRVVSAIAALAITWRAFRRDEPLTRYGALVMGYLLVSPYALWYELALLQPLAVVALLDRRWPNRIAGLLAFTLLPRALGVVALAVASQLRVIANGPRHPLASGQRGAEKRQPISP